MKKLFIILLLATGIAASGNVYALPFPETATNNAAAVNEINSPSFSFVNHSHAELELSTIHSGIFSSVNNIQKQGHWFVSILSGSPAYAHFQNAIPPIPAKAILPLCPDCIYPFHSFW